MASRAIWIESSSLVMMRSLDMLNKHRVVIVTRQNMTIDVEEVEGFLEHTHELGVLVEDVHVAKTVSENDTIQSHMQSLDLIKIQSSTRLINEYNHATHVMSTKEEGCQKWLMFSKFWSCYSKTQDPVETNTIQTNHVFANRSEEDEIHPLTVKEIVEAQKADTALK